MDSQITPKINVQMRVSTHEALKNLFGILKVRGVTFDEQLFELATRAFSAYSDVHPNDTMEPGKVRKTLIKHNKHYRPRKQVQVKTSTIDELRDLHSKMFPFLPWQSWDWLMNEMAEVCRDHLHDSKEKVSSYEPVDENI